jgi:TolB protein
MRSILLALTALALLSAQTLAPRRLAYARAGVQPGQPQLFIAAADGSEERPLLAVSDNDYNPAWAPDGKFLVFTSDRNGSADLYSVNPDGSGLKRLTNETSYDDQAAFSPDGKQLVFVSTRGKGTANLWILDLATRNARELTSGPGGDFRPSWSQDGKWITFSSGHGITPPFSEGRWERLQLTDIYIVHPDGLGLKKLTSTGNFCGSPKWNSDNRRIVAYCMTAQQTMTARRPNPEAGSTTRLVSIDVTTGASTDLPAGPGVKMNPSPLAASEVGYIRKDGGPDAGIYYMSGKRGPRGAIRTASWSPDGRRVVFWRNVAGGTAPPFRKMYSRNPNYELRLVGPLPAFSPSGKQFVTQSRPAPLAAVSALMVTTPETGQVDVVYRDKIRNVLAGGWSPAGDKLIFSVGMFAAFFDGFHSEFLKPGDRVEGGAQVAIVNPDGTGFQELTHGAANSAFPSFAPDGKLLVYRTFAKEGNGLRIMNLETRTVTTLTKEYDNFPLWSPRGDLIVFARLSGGAYQAGGSYDIYTIKPDGTDLKRLTNGQGNDAHMSWSPDGQYIAFASSRMGFKDEITYTDAPQPYGEIFVMRYDGTGVEQLTDDQWEEGTPGWQPSAATRADLGKPPIVSAAEAPAGTETLAVQWVKVAAPGVGVMLAAVARPQGKGPFPVVLLLHGTHGFAQQYVQLAQDLARGGLLAVAACWFSGGSGSGSSFVTLPIGCPEAPPMATNSSPEALGTRTVDALVQAARALPGARPDRVGLVGHSRGGGATLNYLLKVGNVQAAVLHSAGYATQLATRAAQFNAPILILHGTADSPAEGGSAFTNVQMARDFEAALRREGKPVEAMYYEGGGHSSFFTSSTQHDIEVQRMVAFLKRRLGN